MTTHPSEPMQAMLADVEGQQLVQAIHDRKLGKGRTSSADCTCPRSSNGYRRGINPTCPWDGLHTTGFTTAPTP